VSGLRSFAALQARLYAFLEQQDEATLQAIADGTAQLSVVGVDDAPAPAAAPPAVTPSSNPVQTAVQDLARLTSEAERRTYLNASGLPLAGGLRAVAKALKLRRYSSLSRDDLIDLLASHGTSSSPESGPETAAPREARPPVVAAKPDVNVAAIASHLRETETEEDGVAYLRAQHLDRDGLLAVAAELQLTRVSRLSPAELEKRVLKQAIGARRKFAGLRKW
jgi:hypothetical protein